MIHLYNVVDEDLYSEVNRKKFIIYETTSYGLILLVGFFTI